MFGTVNVCMFDISNPQARVLIAVPVAAAAIQLCLRILTGEIVVIAQRGNLVENNAEIAVVDMQNAVLHQALPWGNKPILNVLESKGMLGLVSSDKITVTNSDYFDIYTSYPVELGEHIPTLSQYEDLNEGIALAHLLDGRTL